MTHNAVEKQLRQRVPPATSESEVLRYLTRSQAGILEKSDRYILARFPNVTSDLVCATYVQAEIWFDEQQRLKSYQLKDMRVCL